MGGGQFSQGLQGGGEIRPQKYAGGLCQGREYAGGGVHFLIITVTPLNILVQIKKNEQTTEFVCSVVRNMCDRRLWGINRWLCF